MNLSTEKFRERVLEIVADGGFSSIEELVSLVPIAKLRNHYDWIDEEE